MRLLIIDDEPIFTSQIAKIVAQNFPEVVVSVANTAEDAARMLKDCDAAVSDVTMPNKRILDEAIEEAMKVIPVGRVTGSVIDFDPDFLVSKPFSSPSIVALVARLQEKVKENNKLEVS